MSSHPSPPSLPCNHILCAACIPRLPEPKTCPHCRQSFILDDVETIEFTATQQWDRLLDVATNATKLLGSDEVSLTSADEEDEVPFIEDDAQR